MQKSWGFPLFLSLFVGVGCQSKAEPPKPPPPPQVFYTVPTEKTVVNTEEYPGRLAAQKMVEVRSRVTGYLDEVRFQDGDLVQAGDVLFVIDPRPYQREVERSQAARDQAIAHRDRTQRQEQRLKGLAETRVVSQEEYDTALFDYKESEAAIKVAQATLDLAELNLEYTKITAQVSGRIGRRLIDAGNLVKADDTHLATIVSLDPIYAYFSIDERTMLQLKRLMQQGKLESHGSNHFTVDLALADEEEFHWKGLVNFQDNQVDAHTGTLAARATIENSTGFLTPGLFVRMRTPIGQPQKSLVVPEEALGSDQGKRFLYVIDAENKAIQRDVTVGKAEAGQRVILTGLEQDERVIVTGLQRVRPGMVVTPMDINAPPEQKPVATTGTEGHPLAAQTIPADAKPVAAHTAPAAQTATTPAVPVAPKTPAPSSAN